jgi:hypothetical protein
MDLLTTYTPDSELQAIAVPQLISTIKKITAAPAKTFYSLMRLHQPFPGNGF